MDDNKKTGENTQEEDVYVVINCPGKEPKRFPVDATTNTIDLKLIETAYPNVSGLQFDGGQKEKFVARQIDLEHRNVKAVKIKPGVKEYEVYFKDDGRQKSEKKSTKGNQIKLSVKSCA